MKTYEWRLKLIAGKEISKGVIQAKTLRVSETPRVNRFRC